MNAKILGFGVITSVSAIAVLALCTPNILWLKHSTVRIDNQSESGHASATVEVGNQTLDYRAIEPGESEFALLPEKLGGSMIVMLPPSQSLESFCHTYIEPAMYHVDIVIKDGKVMSCEASLPILSNFWVFKALL